MMEEQVTTQPSLTTLPEVEVLPKSTEVELQTTGSRPTSAGSVTSTDSMGTKRAQSIYMSKFTINTYFSYREGAYDSALSDCKKNAVSEEDGEVLGSWLLAEIDQWDCEQETLVLLTEKSVIVVRYDFVKSRIYKHKKWLLSDITTVKSGDLVYPSMSVMPPRDYGGVRLICGKEDDAGFLARWNFGGAQSMPYWTFTHHRLIYLPGLEGCNRYSVDDFHDALVSQINQVYSDQKLDSTLQNLNEDIVIYSYASLTSMIFNQSSLGYSRDRSGVNY